MLVHANISAVAPVVVVMEMTLVALSTKALPFKSKSRVAVWFPKLSPSTDSSPWVSRVFTNASTPLSVKSVASFLEITNPTINPISSTSPDIENELLSNGSDAKSETIML